MTFDSKPASAGSRWFSNQIRCHGYLDTSPSISTSRQSI